MGNGKRGEGYEIDVVVEVADIEKIKENLEKWIEEIPEVPPLTELEKLLEEYGLEEYFWYEVYYQAPEEKEAIKETKEMLEGEKE